MVRYVHGNPLAVLANGRQESSPTIWLQFWPLWESPALQTKRQLMWACKFGTSSSQQGALWPLSDMAGAFFGFLVQ